jgi:hypothetical protein
MQSQNCDDSYAKKIDRLWQIAFAAGGLVLKGAGQKVIHHRKHRQRCPCRAKGSTKWRFDASTTHHSKTPLAKTDMNLSELLAKRDRGDLPRSIAEAVLEVMMKAGVEGLIGAGWHERQGDHTTGHRRCPDMHATKITASVMPAPFCAGWRGSAS